MSRLIGRRGSSENGWTWLVVPDGRWPRRRVPWRFILGGSLGLAALVALAVSLAVWLASPGDGGPAAQPVERDEQTPARPTATPPTATPEADSAFPIPLGPGPYFRLAVWSDVESEWKTGSLAAVASGYHEGDSIPFMLRIDKARPGATYPLTVRYVCAEGEAHAFDFLSGYQPPEGGPQPALASGGPGSASPESLTPIRDDLTLAYDDSQTARAFAVWGGSLLDASGPLPQLPCGKDGPRDRVYILGVSAAKETVFLLWGAHLASALDWAAGASSLSLPLKVQVEVQGLTTVSVSLDVGAVHPLQRP